MIDSRNEAVSKNAILFCSDDCAIEHNSAKKRVRRKHYTSLVMETRSNKNIERHFLYLNLPSALNNRRHIYSNMRFNYCFPYFYSCRRILFVEHKIYATYTYELETGRNIKK